MLSLGGETLRIGRLEVSESDVLQHAYTITGSPLAPLTKTVVLLRGGLKGNA